MDRLVAWYRVSSAAEPVASLLVANLVPLAGVLFWGWDLWTILALYWAENGVVGAWNVAKILLARGPAAVAPGGPAAVAPGGPASGLPSSALGNVAMAVFFTIHYGMFWFVHGLFVLVALPQMTSFLGPDATFGYADPGLLDVGARLGTIAFATLALAISHGVSFWFNYIGRGEYRRVTPIALTGAPYARVVVLHLTIIFGAFVSIALGSPIGALVVLVVLKTALDLRLHAREHRDPNVSG